MIINMITNFNMAKTSDLHYAQSFPKQQACLHTPGLPRTAGNEQLQIVFTIHTYYKVSVDKG